MHGLTGWRRLDLGQQCSAVAGWQQQQFEIRALLSNLQFAFSHSPPQTPTRDDNDCPLCAIKTRRHCARRPVAASATACDTFSIAGHRASRPAACADGRLPIPGFKASKGRSPGHQGLPRSSRGEQQSSPQDSSIHAETRIPLPRSFNTCRVAFIPSLLPFKYSQHLLQGTRAGNTLPGDRSRHRSVRHPSIRHPPRPSAHLHLPSAIGPSPLRGARGVAGKQTNRESLPCCCCSVLGGHAIAGLSTEESIALLLRSSLHHVRIFFRLVLSHCPWSLRIAPPHPTYAPSMLAAALLACP